MRPVTRGVQCGRWQFGVTVARRGVFVVVAAIFGRNAKGRR
jgi:hypothetical protein